MRGQRPAVSLLLPLSGACYNRRVRIAAERDALGERRPQQITFLRTYHEWPNAKRAIPFCARRPLVRPPETRREVWRDTAA